jgi:hypothetical protein
MFDTGAPEFRRHSSRNVFPDGAQAGGYAASGPHRPTPVSSRNSFDQQPSQVVARQAPSRKVLHGKPAMETELTPMRTHGSGHTNPVGPGGVFQPGYSGQDAPYDGGYAVPYDPNEGMMITYAMPDGRPVPGPPRQPDPYQTSSRLQAVRRVFSQQFTRCCHLMAVLSVCPQKLRGGLGQASSVLGSPGSVATYSSPRI